MRHLKKFFRPRVNSHLISRRESRVNDWSAPDQINELNYMAGPLHYGINTVLYGDPKQNINSFRLQRLTKIYIED